MVSGRGSGCCRRNGAQHGLSRTVAGLAACNAAPSPPSGLPAHSLPPEVQRVVLEVVLDPDTSLLRKCIAPSKLDQSKKANTVHAKSLRCDGLGQCPLSSTGTSSKSMPNHAAARYCL